MKPSDFNLPSKFINFRPNQLMLSYKATLTSKYAYMLDCPTGSGKSLMGAAAQRIIEKPIVYVCTTKQLQDQLLEDFPYARVLKGRNNYRCAMFPRMFPEITAEMCIKDGGRCLKENQCEYMRAKWEAASSPIAILNMSYYLAEANFNEADSPFANRELLVIDEFDTVEGQLMSFVEFTITQKTLDRMGIQAPIFKTKYEAWLIWARSTIEILRKEYDSLSRLSIDEWHTENYKEIKRRIALGRMISKLNFFIDNVDKNWVWYPGTDRWSFKPVWVNKYANYELWRHAKKVIGMSATILDPVQIAINTGLIDSNRSYGYEQLPSPFPKEIRPVIYEPIVQVTSKTMKQALPLIKRALERLLEKYPNDKMLFHTVTFDIAKYIVSNIPNKRLITHTTFNRIDILTKFKTSKDPLVLVSPSMDRGVDLPKDECRVVVIIKVPYPDLHDPQINRRLYSSADGQNWYAHRTISTIIQMAGRGVRSEDDYAKTYILDAKFGDVYNDHTRLFPGWFKEALLM